MSATANTFPTRHKKKPGAATVKPGTLAFAGSASSEHYEYDLHSGIVIQRSLKNMAAILIEPEGGKQRIFMFDSVELLDKFVAACTACQAGNKNAEQKPEMQEPAPGRTPSGAASNSEPEQPGEDAKASSRITTADQKLPQQEAPLQEEDAWSKRIAAFLEGDEDNEYLQKILDAHGALFEQYVLEERSHTPAQFLRHVLSTMTSDASINQQFALPQARPQPSAFVASAGPERDFSRYLNAFATEDGTVGLDSDIRQALLEENPPLQKLHRLYVNDRYSDDDFWNEFCTQSNYFLLLQGKNDVRRRHNPKFDPYIPQELKFDQESNPSGFAHLNVAGTSSSGARNAANVLPTQHELTLDASSAPSRRKMQQLLGEMDDPNAAGVVQKLDDDSNQKWRLTQWNNNDQKMLAGAELGKAHTSRTRILHRVNQLSARALPHLLPSPASGKEPSVRSSSDDENEMEEMVELSRKKRRLADPSGYATETGVARSDGTNNNPSDASLSTDPRKPAPKSFDGNTLSPIEHEVLKTIANRRYQLPQDKWPSSVSMRSIRFPDHPQVQNASKHLLTKKDKDKTADQGHQTKAVQPPAIRISKNDFRLLEQQLQLFYAPMSTLKQRQLILRKLDMAIDELQQERLGANERYRRTSTNNACPQHFLNQVEHAKKHLERMLNAIDP
ncbi:unnamed protein product [Amoebophrya sp. A120]|nr:unnamed protein product [Amoebophrya sp. A120]|eukprot:GSA120T00025372001.1